MTQATLAGPGAIVISQVYTNGGASGAVWRNDYIELFNRSAASVSVSGWSVQTTGNTGSVWNRINLPATTLQPGQFLLVQMGSAGANGSLLPTPDATNTTNIGNVKVALVHNTTTLSGACPIPSVDIEDFVGIGGANCFEGAVAANTSNVARAIFRRNITDGCIDTDNNQADLTAADATPRNTASPFASCVPTGACCTSGACAVGTQVACAGVYQGDDVPCSPDPCPTGACCIVGQSCAVMTTGACAAASGTFYLGGGCSPDPCDIGACCTDTDCFAPQSRNDCETGGGVYQGNGSVCETYPCAPTGACCTNDGSSCAVVPGPLCVEIYSGDGTTCPALPCPVGACCEGSACNISNMQGCALVVGRVFRGVGTVCDPDPCIGACCTGTAHTCSIEQFFNCGFFVGYGTTCLPNPCIPPVSGACCLTSDSCFALNNVQCAGFPGAIFTGGGLCSPNPCGPTVVCCVSATCSVTNRGRCIFTLGGTVSTAAACVPNPCGPQNGCCLTDRCVVNTFEQCAAQGGTYHPGFSCTAANPCNPMFGACCDANMICSLTSAAACTGPGLSFQGATTTCSGSPCNIAITGACCHSFTNACTIRTQSNCLNPSFGNGSYLGHGTACTPIDPCIPPITGACCLGLNCTHTTAVLCISPSVYKGDNSMCSAEPCERACCTAAGACTISAPALCGGTSNPNSATCSPAACQGACCVTTGCQIVNTVAECNALESGAVFRLGEVCTPFSTCSGACCFRSGLVCQVILQGSCAASETPLYLGNNTTCEMNPCVGTCCDVTSGECTIQNYAACRLTPTNIFIDFAAAGSMCAPSPCPGACCLPDGSCLIMYSSPCALSAGVYLDNGEACDANACLGACCTETGCALSFRLGCTAPGEVFKNEGTPCTPSPCSAACCLLDGTCIVANNSSFCQSQGGTIQTALTCAPGTCPTGACCQRDVPGCIITSALYCTQVGQGYFLGIDTTCQPNVCVAACCIHPIVAGLPLVCVYLDLVNCYGLGGEYHGLNTVCDNPVGSDNWTACCGVNVNGAAGVTIQDLFDFLALYFGQNPIADVNHSGAITVQDIFDFLAGYFYGCS